MIVVVVLIWVVVAGGVMVVVVRLTVVVVTVDVAGFTVVLVVAGLMVVVTRVVLVVVLSGGLVWRTDQGAVRASFVVVHQQLHAQDVIECASRPLTFVYKQLQAGNLPASAVSSLT